MKMPDPTMPPITSIVAPKRPISRASPAGAVPPAGGGVIRRPAARTRAGAGAPRAAARRASRPRGRPRALEAARQAVRHRHAAHARGERRAHAVGRVLEHDARRGRARRAACAASRNSSGSGLTLRHVVAGHDHVEEVVDAVARAASPRPSRSELLEATARPRPRSRASRSSALDARHAAAERRSRCAVSAFTSARSASRSSGPPRSDVEVLERVEAAVGAERVLPLVERRARGRGGGRPANQASKIGVSVSTMSPSKSRMTAATGSGQEASRFSRAPRPSWRRAP